MSGYEEAANQFGGQMADPSASTAPDYSGIAAKFGGKVATAKQVATSAYQGASDWVAETFGPNGNLRGSAIGGVMQGMADPVAGAVQFAANLPGVRSIAGDRVNAGIQAKEAEYESSRARAGRDGFDAARFAGSNCSFASKRLKRAV